MRTKPHESRDCACAECEKWRQWVEGEEDGWRPTVGADDDAYSYHDEPTDYAPQYLTNEVFRIGDAVYLNKEGLATHDAAGVFVGYALTFEKIK